MIALHWVAFLVFLAVTMPHLIVWRIRAPVGTKSLLFGVHQFIWHPITVLIAWCKLYGWPTWPELVCIIVHDWGYWGKPNMDGPEGEKHPELGAAITGRLFGWTEHDLCLYHSRHYSRNAGKDPSDLCWADKLSLVFDPPWLYLPRAWLSGELFEYRKVAHDYGELTLDKSHLEWYRWVRKRLTTLAKERRGDAVRYANPERGNNG